MLWVYAFARDLADARGFQVIDFGSFSAIVEEVEQAREANTENALAFDRTLLGLWKRSASLVPARFATTAADLGELVRGVEPQRDALERALALVTGRAQMTLRLSGKRRAVPELAGGYASGTDYLRQKLAAERRSRVLVELDPYRRLLDPLLVAERIEHSENMPWFARAYHLVDRTKLARYLIAVDACVVGLMREELALTWSGPRAPYAFAPGARE